MQRTSPQVNEIVPGLHETGTTPGQPFQFGIRSLFFALTASAVLAAGWPWRWSGEGQLLLLVYVGVSTIQCGLALLAITSWRRERRENVAMVPQDENRMFLVTLAFGLVVPVLLMLAMLGMLVGGRSFTVPLAVCFGLMVAQMWMIIPLVGSLLTFVKSQARIPLAVLLLVNLGASFAQVFGMVLVASISC